MQLLNLNSWIWRNVTVHTYTSMNIDFFFFFEDVKVPASDCGLFSICETLLTDYHLILHNIRRHFLKWINTRQLIFRNSNHLSDFQDMNCTAMTILQYTTVLLCW